MSRLINKKMSQDFVRFLTEGLISLGAKRVEDKIDSHIEFEMDTIVGKLSISIPKEQQTIFSVYSRFQDVDKAKQKFNCNPHSGKYNVYIGLAPEMTAKIASDAALSAFEITVETLDYSTTKPL